MTKTIFTELDHFKNWQSQLHNSSLVNIQDEYLICTGSSSQNSNKPIDLLITGLMHGNEVIGLEIINHLLQSFQKKLPKIRVTFLLCNIPAALKNQRFLEKDLNRCFLIQNPQTAEEKRAQQIEKLAQHCHYLIDLHQTVEATESVFFVLEQKKELMEFAEQISTKIPLVTFPLGGFSEVGKTLIECGTYYNAKAITIECGQLGFSEDISTKITRAILHFMTALEKKSLQKTTSTSFKTFHMKHIIKNSEGAYLKPGWINFHSISKGDVIGFRGKDPILSPCEGRIFFPKYGELAKKSNELCEIGESLYFSAE